MESDLFVEKVEHVGCKVSDTVVLKVVDLSCKDKLVHIIRKGNK